MAASEQNKYIQFVNILNNKNFFGDVNKVVISPLFNYLCVITKQKNASLYLLPNFECTPEPLWRCPSKVMRCLFSDDGKIMLVILSVNSFQIYSVNGKNISLLVQIKASLLMDLLQEYNIDFSAASYVKPMKLKYHEFIFMLDRKLILCMEWSYVKSPTVKYSISVESYRDIFLKGNMLFILFRDGITNAYNSSTGAKYQGELNVSSGHIAQSFFKLSVHFSTNILALVNQYEETILFDTNQVFCDEKDGSNKVKKENWVWPYKSQKSKRDSKVVSLYRILGKVSPPPGLVVSSLHFSLKGLFAFYCILGQPKCSSFKVVDEYTGSVLYNFDGLVESTVISGGPLPVVMTDSILSICLGVLCNHYFIIKLCEAIPNCGFPKEFDKTLLTQDPRNEDVRFYPYFLEIILSLHLNVFYSSLLLLTENRFSNEGEKVDLAVSDKKILERTCELFKVVQEYEGDDTSVKDQMLESCLVHAIRLLDVVQVEHGSICGAYLFPVLLKQILSLYETVKDVDPLRQDWVTWLGMTDVEIIQESLAMGTIGLAHVFLVTNRNWQVDEAETKFRAEAHSWIIQLISMGDMEKAKTALRHMGCDPVKYLKCLCLETNDYLLRDLLISHLIELEECSTTEVEAWNFSRRIESSLSSTIKRYPTYEEKMTVSATDRVHTIAFKLAAFNGSLDLATILNSTTEWRNTLITELYFNTGDVALEKDLEKQLCWNYLVETNKISLIRNWIDINCDSSSLNFLNKSSDYLVRSFYNLFAEWPLAEDLLDSLHQMKCMAVTKTFVLDSCAFYGLFAADEKTNLRNIVCRLENNCLLSSIRNILSLPTSNVNPTDFDYLLVRKCLSHSLEPIVLMFFNDALLPKDSLLYKMECPWANAWNLFSTWEKNKGWSNAILKDAVFKTRSIYECTNLEYSYLSAAVALSDEKEISEIVQVEGEECALLRLPLMKITWQTAQSKIDQKPDVTLYELLAFSNIPADKLFLWQSQNRNPVSAADVFPEFPHFNHQILGIKCGFRQNLDHIYYIRQSRPSFACNFFVIESLRTQRRLTTKMIKRVCRVVHGLALRFWKDVSIGNACVAFIAMLGDIASANVLRIHLGAIECIFRCLPANERFYIGSLVRGIVTKELIHLQEMASILERSAISNKENSITQLEKWGLAVCFSNTHSLPLPTLYLKVLARNHDWLSFIICMDVFKYPYEQAIELIEEIDSKILKSHLIRALTRTTLKLSTMSPSKSPPKILLEPDSNGKEEVETTNLRDNRDAFHSFVANIYTEVLNTIQTFTDKNIVLPWSCEQDPDGDVLLTLLKCESEPDTSKSLLVSSIELQSPALAVLATCFQSDSVYLNLIAWLVSSIPTSMTRMKRREEGQQLLDRLYGPIEMEALLFNFFSTGYFQTFFRGMHLFMPDNPMTLFLNAVYHSIVVLDFETGFELLKEFIIEISHFRVKEPDVLFLKKDCILNVVAQFVSNLLTRPDMDNSTKRRFLRIVAESDLSSLDTRFPQYLLWSQICDILESCESNLDFIRLCDLSLVSDELQNCLDLLTKHNHFTQALEICSLLSLNRDQFVVTMWNHQFSLFLKSDMDIENIWRESSLAFKDENVNPNLAASFYYNMASYFQSPSADSLRYRYISLDYCLHWRRLMEDTLSTSFKEESDAIEMEKWKCCLEPDFDLDILRNSDPVDISHSLLINIRSATKVFVRYHQGLETETEKQRVENLINIFLEQGNLFKALRIGAFFKSHNQDMVYIKSCLKVAQEEVTHTDLAKLSSIITKTPKTLWFQSQYLEGTDLTENDTVPSKEQHQMLQILSKLCQIVNYGKPLANRIFVCFRLSVNLDLTFKDVASERDYLSLLPRSATLTGINKFNVASDLITLADLPPSDLSKLIKDKVVSAVLEHESADSVLAPVTLWGISLDCDFHLIINMMDNPSMLGVELLQASVNLPCRAAVEVLIRAHDCFRTSCNVEGISGVLRRARILASLALQEGQWHYLVRLLVGIERYSEMNYIFRMLKDNGQFEQLLRKGMHKVPRLHVAISEFLQRYCPQDQEMSKMVAAHFGLHSKLATFWQEEAEEIISKLSTADNILKDNGKNRQALSMIIDNYSHASHWFLQAGKLNRALKMAHKAQMVALQISLLGGPFILKLQSLSELQALISDTLSVGQIMLISRAYDYEPDWIAALHERWVLKGDKTFYADLKSSFILSSQLAQSYSFRYNLDMVVNTKAKDRMKQVTTYGNHSESPLITDLRK